MSRNFGHVTKFYMAILDIPPTTMTATVQDLITVLKTFFPNELLLNRVMYVLITVTTLYPILHLHDHQVQQPHQPWRTGWLKSIGALLMWAFHPE
jgi:hypothetical protein